MLGNGGAVGEGMIWLGLARSLGAATALHLLSGMGVNPCVSPMYLGAHGICHVLGEPWRGHDTLCSSKSCGTTRIRPESIAGRAEGTRRSREMLGTAGAP